MLLFFALQRPLRAQPLESTEFRLRVSNSVDPATMYTKTLEATKVSHASECSMRLEIWLVVFNWLLCIIAFEQRLWFMRMVGPVLPLF